ncbi:MAG: [FeFe] hydrogenase H-cluster maturation GTPase HydF [Clostridia bacterium]|nr:[FeFe] hydrogenase H-cluster maturation GTPase HydF [Clostridia bacterium]
MSLNDTPLSGRIHIAFLGRRNVGKSSLVNAVTGQSLSIVSNVKGTTTDPVYKSMELLPLGPVVIIDTPGIDDEGELGAQRVKKARQVLAKTDIAILVTDEFEGLAPQDEELLGMIREREIPYIVVRNKADLVNQPYAPLGDEEMRVSANTSQGIENLKRRLCGLNTGVTARRLVGDLLLPGDIVILVTPIDGAAPKDRLILPQQQTIRDILDANAIAVISKETELAHSLDALAKEPRMVITDSQVFERVADEVPQDIPLTSFSILMARRKGFLETAAAGARTLDNLHDGDVVLISEGCTHHRQCEDIGTVKLPGWIRKHTEKKLVFQHTSGGEFPESLRNYSLVVHCGGCMLNEREIHHRIALARDANVPFTNYGIAIAHMKGILERALKPLLP